MSAHFQLMAWYLENPFVAGKPSDPKTDQMKESRDLYELKRAMLTERSS